MNEQTSSSPGPDQAMGSDARDDADAATVLRDTGAEMPGGGGLGGADAGSGLAPAGGASPNAPLPGALPDAGGEAAWEARTRATDPSGR